MKDAFNKANKSHPLGILCEQSLWHLNFTKTSCITSHMTEWPHNSLKFLSKTRFSNLIDTTRWIYLCRKVTGLASNNLQDRTFSQMKSLHTKNKKNKEWIKEHIGLAHLQCSHQGKTLRWKRLRVQGPSGRRVSLKS